MMGGPPPLIRPDEKNKKPLPRSIREVPGFIRRVIHSLTSRLCYIFRLVWEAKPWIFFVMLAYAVISGIMPVAGALIAAEIINALVSAVSGDGEFSRIVWLLLFQFGCFRWMQTAEIMVSAYAHAQPKLIRLKNALIKSEEF